MLFTAGGAGNLKIQIPACILITAMSIILTPGVIYLSQPEVARMMTSRFTFIEILMVLLVLLIVVAYVVPAIFGQ